MVDSYLTKIKGIHPRSTLKNKENHRPGTDIVQEDMDQLNDRYRDLVARVNLRVDTINSAGNVANVRRFFYSVYKFVKFVLNQSGINLHNVGPGSASSSVNIFRFSDISAFLNFFLYTDECFCVSVKDISPLEK